MPRRRRNAAEIARDKKRIGSLYLKGWLQSEIAEEVGLSIATISRDLVTLHDEWRQSALVDINEAKIVELAKIDTLEREYWRGWERSLKDAETIKQEGGVEVKRVSRTKRTRDGDARFLEGVLKCIDRRCKILGLDSPAKLMLERDWQAEAEALGIDPVQLVQELTEKAVQVIEGELVDEVPDRDEV